PGSRWRTGLENVRMMTSCRSAASTPRTAPICAELRHGAGRLVHRRRDVVYLRAAAGDRAPAMTSSSARVVSRPSAISPRPSHEVPRPPLAPAPGRPGGPGARGSDLARVQELRAGCATPPGHRRARDRRRAVARAPPGAVVGLAGHLGAVLPDLHRC